MATDVYQLVVRGTCAGEFWETVQHYKTSVTGAIDPVTTAGRLIEGFRNNVMDLLTVIRAADSYVTGFSAKRVNNGGSPTVMLPIVPVPGDVGGTSASSALAYLIVSEYTFSSHFRTGRWFIPSIPEANLVGNSYTAGAITDVGAVVVANSAFTETETFVWGVWSRTHSDFFTPTYAHLSAKVGVQRRRLLPVQ